MNAPSQTPPCPLIKHTIVILITVVVAFFVTSILLLFIHVQKGTDHIAGQIVDISPNAITISNARGVETTLVLSDATTITGKTNTLVLGLFIHSGGEKISDDVFASYRIRVIKKP